MKQNPHEPNYQAMLEENIACELARDVVDLADDMFALAERLLAPTLLEQCGSRIHEAPPLHEAPPSRGELLRVRLLTLYMRELLDQAEEVLIPPDNRL